MASEHDTGPGGEHDHDICCWLKASRKNLHYGLDGRLSLEDAARATIKLLDRALLAWPPSDDD